MCLDIIDQGTDLLNFVDFILCKVTLFLNIIYEKGFF